MQKLIIKQRLPNLNEYDAANKKSRYAAGNIKKEWTEYVMWEARKQLKPITEQVRMDFIWIEANKKRDPDNICFAKKFILDGIVTAGILKNDGHKQISGFSDSFEFRDYYGVEITII